VTGQAVDTVADGAEEPAWKWRLLGELCQTTSGGTPTRKRADFFEGTIPWVKSGELPDGPVSEIEEFITDDALANSSAKVFPAGTLLIALYGATVGKLGILTRDAATNQAVCAVFPPKELDTRFLFWHLRLRRANLAAQAVGGAQPNISQTILRSLHVPVPPIDQQRRIVAELEKQFSRLEKAVATLTRAIVAMSAYRASVLEAAVRGQLVSESGPTSASRLDDLIGQIHQGWSPKCDLQREPGPDEWAVITTTAVQPMKYLDNQGKPLPAALEPRPRLEVQPGDFLVTRKGPRARAGVACLVRRTRRRLMVCDTVYRFRCDESKVVPDYLEIALNAPSIVQAIDRKKAGINESGVSLTHEKLGGVAIPVPSREAQHRIVAEVDRRLSIVREVEAEVDANLKRAQALRQAVLARAFSVGSEHA